MSSKKNHKLNEKFSKILIFILCFFYFSYGLVNLSQIYRSSSINILIGSIFIIFSLLIYFKKTPTFLHTILHTIFFFIIFQSLMTPLIKNPNYITLKPLIKKEFFVNDGLMGIFGHQIVTTDKKGFRTTKKINYEENKTFRIFVIGGSTAESIYLDDYKTWPALLESNLQKNSKKEIEVINTGVSGLRAIHHIATINVIKKFNPDLIIIFLGINDWNHVIKRNDLIKESNYAFITLFINLNQYLRLISFDHSLLFKMKSLTFKKKEKKDIENKIKVRIESGNYYKFQYGSIFNKEKRKISLEGVDSTFKKSFGKIIDICSKLKVKKVDCLILNQPNGYSVSANKDYQERWWMTPPDKNFTLEVAQLVELSNFYNSYIYNKSIEKNVMACDIANTLPKSFETFYDEVHFNSNGSILMANEAEKCMKNNNILLNKEKN